MLENVCVGEGGCGGGEGGSAGVAPGAEVGDGVATPTPGSLEPGLESGAEVNVLLPMDSFRYMRMPVIYYLYILYRCVCVCTYIHIYIVCVYIYIGENVWDGVAAAVVGEP